MDFDYISDEQIQKIIGTRLRRKRLNSNMSQDELATLSGVSRRTITNLEGGKGGSLLTLIAVLRGLNLLDNLAHFIPDVGISPAQIARLRGKERRRATGSRGRKAEDAGSWEWNE